MNIGYELSRIAEVVNPINGMTLPKARKTISDIMHKAQTRSLYNDEYWQGPNEVMKALSAKGVDWELVKAEYSPDNKIKTWHIKVTFQNEKGSQKELSGLITAFQAGSIKDPWDKYDITAQIF